MALIKNNSDTVHVVADVGKEGVGVAWMPAGDESKRDVISVSDEQIENSLGILQLMQTPVDDGSGKMAFEKLEGKARTSYISERANRGVDKSGDGSEIIAADNAGALTDVLCMGVSEKGAPCDKTVNIVIDGKEYPLCRTHSKQKDRCVWDKKNNAWIGMRLADFSQGDESQDLMALEKKYAKEIAEARNTGVVA